MHMMIVVTGDQPRTSKFSYGSSYAAAIALVASLCMEQSCSGEYIYSAALFSCYFILCFSIFEEGIYKLLVMVLYRYFYVRHEHFSCG